LLAARPPHPGLPTPFFFLARVADIGRATTHGAGTIGPLGRRLRRAAAGPGRAQARGPLGRGRPERCARPVSAPGPHVFDLSAARRAA